jgi:TRAP-type uncharacterized transport system fused permease subunit
MPPLMGAGAFVMVELTGIPYTEIMSASVLPALLFFFTVWIGINAFSSRMELKAVDVEDRPSAKTVWITAMFFFVPFLILLERMFLGRYTPQFAACVAILAASLLLILNAKMEVSLKRALQRLQAVCLNSGRQIAMIASIIICAGIIIGVLGQTGLGVKISSTVISASGGMLWPALLLTAFACLLLGMEVPTTAAYLICVSVAGPALQSLGLPLLITHLFVFWYALLSTITPPVCGTVFIAAGMVEEKNWLKVAGKSMALGVGLYLVPLGMVANPALIELSTNPLGAIMMFLKIALSLALISYGIIAARTFIFRLGLIIGGAVILFI